MAKRKKRGKIGVKRAAGRKKAGDPEKEKVLGIERRVWRWASTLMKVKEQARLRKERTHTAIGNLVAEKKYIVAVHDPHRVDLFEFKSEENLRQFAEKAIKTGCEITESTIPLNPEADLTAAPKLKTAPKRKPKATRARRH